MNYSTSVEGKAGVSPDEARVLAEFNLTGLPPGPDRDRVEITLTIDASGLILVKAVDLFSRVEITGTVQAGSIQKSA